MWPPRWKRGGMHTTGTHQESIPRGECLQLVAAASVGRIIYTRHALPAVELVTFTLEGSDIVVRTMPEPLTAVIRDSVIAFEADQVSPHDWSGWIVTVIGTARCSSSAGGHGHVIRIRPEIVTGLRLAPPAAPPLAA
jgi:uncharacterized protein